MSRGEGKEEERRRKKKETGRGEGITRTNYEEEGKERRSREEATVLWNVASLENCRFANVRFLHAHSFFRFFSDWKSTFE